MSGHDEADLGIQAFRDMTAAMDRLGATMKTVDRQQQLRLAGEEEEASKAKVAAEIALKAAQTGLEAAKTKTRLSVLWTAVTAVLGVLTASCGGYWLGRASGWERGEAAGYAEAREEKAAASWANTPNGRRALALDQLGSLSMLVNCSAEGWQQGTQDGRRVCYPKANAKGSTSGWFIP